MTGTGDFLTNLAAALAYDLLRVGAEQLKRMALGSPEEQALRRCYEAAFAAMLKEVAADLDDDHQEIVGDILREFVATPAVAEALLAALRDAGPVQQDALAAAERFRLAEGDIVPALAAALQDESAATAFAAAQVLAALGRSAQAADRRPAIVEALAAALRNPGARRGVYVLDEKQQIKYLGRLDEALYRALVPVTGAGV